MTGKWQENYCVIPVSSKWQENGSVIPYPRSFDRTVEKNKIPGMRKPGGRILGTQMELYKFRSCILIFKPFLSRENLLII